MPDIHIQWEYTTAWLDAGDDSALNSLGAYGWQLVSAQYTGHPNPDEVMYIFRRAINMRWRQGADGALHRVCAPGAPYTR